MAFQASVILNESSFFKKNSLSINILDTFQWNLLKAKASQNSILKTLKITWFNTLTPNKPK